MSGLGKSVIAFPGSGSLNMEQNRASRILLVNDNDDTRELLADLRPLLEKPRLLIIEDDPDTAELAHRMLRSRFDIDIATDGNTGLHAWRARRHDLVLLDAMLPKMGGADVLRHILKEDPGQTVVIMTADGSVDRCENLMLRGAADFVPKPFHAHQLRQICEMAVRR